MDSYIVRQALVNEKQESFGYEILYTDNSFRAEHTDDVSAANSTEKLLFSPLLLICWKKAYPKCSKPISLLFR